MVFQFQQCTSHQELVDGLNPIALCTNYLNGANVKFCEKGFGDSEFLRLTMDTAS